MEGRMKAISARACVSAAAVLCGALLSLTALSQESVASRAGVLLKLDGPVTPANAQYLAREIAAASEAQKELILVEIDTPGGLVDSMKTIVKAILASDTPVATYVAPQGARSASAGVYIMYSAHVSAMAPSTNTGAATPVEIGGAESPADESRKDGGKEDKGADSELGDANDGAAAEPPVLSSSSAMRAKIINDSVAYIRSLAAERGRNADWAEKAVREAVSIPAREALELKVIDYIAEDRADLLKQMDGRKVRVAHGEKTLHTAGLELQPVEPTTIEKILGFLADPNIVVILMSLGTTGLIIEMWHPGTVFPGVLGLTCLILGLYSVQVLPFNWLGLVLMGAGALFVAIEAYTPTLGLIGLAGAVLFGFGLFMVFPAGFEVSKTVIVALLAIIGSLLSFILFALVGSRSHGPLIGAEAIRRREGVVEDWEGKEGWVIVEGERWRARADKTLKKGERVRVLEVDGLVLVVRQAKASLLGALMPNEA
jgi:membrane-bound serine protease (ClpP class)